MTARAMKLRATEKGLPRPPAEHRDQLMLGGQLSARNSTQPTTARRNVVVPGRRREARPGLGERPVQGQEQRVVSAPGDESPVRTMPEPTQQHRDEDVPVRLDLTVAATAHGDVQVVAQDRRQGDVPAAPEIGRVPGLVRRCEVLRQAESEEPAQPDRHVAVPREIEVELEGVAEGAGPGGQGRQAGRAREQGVDHGGDAVRHVLVTQGEEKDHAESSSPWGRVVDAVEVGFDLPKAHDRSGDELAEQGDIAGELEEVPRRLDGAAIAVDDVRDRMERIEGDPHGNTMSIASIGTRVCAVEPTECRARSSGT